jgi:hypothetical protein
MHSLKILDVHTSFLMRINTFFYKDDLLFLTNTLTKMRYPVMLPGVANSPIIAYYLLPFGVPTPYLFRPVSVLQRHRGDC